MHAPMHLHVIDLQLKVAGESHDFTKQGYRRMSCCVLGCNVQLMPSEASETQDISWPVSRGSARRRKWKKARAIKWTW